MQLRHRRAEQRLGLGLNSLVEPGIQCFRKRQVMITGGSISTSCRYQAISAGWARALRKVLA